MSVSTQTIGSLHHHVPGLGTYIPSDPVEAIAYLPHDVIDVLGLDAERAERVYADYPGWSGADWNYMVVLSDGTGRFVDYGDDAWNPAIRVSFAEPIEVWMYLSDNGIED